MLKEDINATVSQLYGLGDYTQKYPLVFASGDEFDLIYTANWAYYNNQATKVDLGNNDGYVGCYAPMTAASI